MLSRARQKTGYKIGIERETLRCQEDGRLALTPHPSVFGDKLDNQHITVDFSESQPEIITDPFSDVESCYESLKELTKELIEGCRQVNEYIWPQSMPCILPETDRIPIADYGERGLEQRAYREKLCQKYDKKMQMICGVHLNFSFSESFFDELIAGISDLPLFYSRQQFKDRIYMKVAENYLKYHWLIVYLTGATPVKLDSREQSRVQSCAVSFRNSPSGYSNKSGVQVNFHSIEKYVSSIQQMIAEGLIISEKEVYAPVRLKRSDKTDAFEDLAKKGIDYIEIRSLDVNLFEPCGIDRETMYFMVNFLYFCALTEQHQDYENILGDRQIAANHTCGSLNEVWKETDEQNQINEQNKSEEQMVPLQGISDELRARGLRVLNEMQQINQIYMICPDMVRQEMKERLENYHRTPAYRTKELLLKEGYVKGSMEQIKKRDMQLNKCRK